MNKWTREQAELLDVAPGGMPTVPRVTVIADAGSGKTSTLVERIRRIVAESGQPAPRILCVSFTEKSKADLESRLVTFPLVEVYTIHGFCLRIVQDGAGLLGMSPKVEVAGEEDCEVLLRNAFEKTYRRVPPSNLAHGHKDLWRLCLEMRKAHPAGKNVEMVEPPGEGDSLEGPYEKFARQVLAAYDGEKKRRRWVEYGDLEHSAVMLLQDKSFSSRWLERYAHVFVDEFQDTNSLQCALIERLTGAKKPLFVVGDPKQSIYRFRGAEVEVFEEFARKNGTTKHLSSNFRSAPEVVDAVNSVSRAAIENYHDMVAGRGPGNNWPESLPRISRIACDDETTGLSALLRKLRSEGVSLSDVVLISRRMKGRDEIHRELARAGVRVAPVSSASLSQSKEIDTLVSLWVWACQPWRTLERADVYLHFFAIDRKNAFDSFEAPQSISAASSRSCEDLLATLEREFNLRARFGVLFDQFETIVFSHQSEGLGPQALALRFLQCKENEIPVGDLQLLNPPQDLSSSVRAYTVHASKGLEFPVVILTGLGARARSGGAILRKGNKIWIAGRDEEGDLDKSLPGFEEMELAEKDAAKQEAGRTLYVALTRARDALYVIDDVDASKSDPWVGWVREGIEKELRIDSPVEIAAPSEKADDLQFARPATQLPEYRSARLGVTEWIQSQESELGEKPIYGAALEMAADVDKRELGTRVHAILELPELDREALRAVSQETGLDFSTFLDWLESDEARNFFPGAEDIVTGGKQVLTEFSLEWESAKTGATMTGTLDRLVLDAASKTAWVVDYKVLTRRSSGQSLALRYGPQLELYAEAVKLLFPDFDVRTALIDVTQASGSIVQLA